MDDRNLTDYASRGGIIIGDVTLTVSVTTRTIGETAKGNSPTNSCDRPTECIIVERIAPLPSVRR